MTAESWMAADAAGTPLPVPGVISGSDALDADDTMERFAAREKDAAGAVSYSIAIDRDACIRCGLCVSFCPTEVYALEDGEPRAVNPQWCWGCETCSGNCPRNAITIEVNPESLAADDDHPRARLIDDETAATYREWAQTLREVLQLRWHPVGVRLIRAGEPYPEGVQIPKERMRYCQSMLAARRGVSLLMPANRHSCPDGTSILGLTDVPPKLASGEIYLLFHKLDTREAASRMVNERPMLEPHSMDATCVFPLDDPKATADVVSIVGNPEQMMWLSMATSYYTGHRHDFHASGYNSHCVEVTLLPLTTKQINISFGCYGGRASTDVGDDMMMMGIPIELMPDIVKGVRELSKRVIPQERDKVYLPPMRG